MSRPIDSDALQKVAQSLGLSGYGAQGTSFNDAVLDQVFDVAPLIRRGRTIASFSGVYTFVFQNEHSGSGTLVTSIDVLDVPAIGNLVWPRPVPEDMDVWLLGAAVQQTAGAGTLSGALFVHYDPGRQGFGVNDDDSALVVSNPVPVARWDAIVTINTNFALQENGDPWKRLGIRLPRAISGTGARVIFVSTASELASFACQMQMGLFPVGLGQDAIV